MTSSLRKIANGLAVFLGFRQAEDPENRLRVLNATRSTVLATHLEVAHSAKKRKKGLLGRDGLAPGEGLWIVPCESVHTFSMRFPIDLIYLDRENRVRKVRDSVGAWRISACLTAHSVLELPAGTVRNTATRRGDVLEFMPAVAGSTDAMHADSL
jgi:uncharacterized protein